jgi:hypothetical protein
MELFPFVGALGQEIDVRLVPLKLFDQLRLAHSPFSPEDNQLRPRFPPFPFQKSQFFRPIDEFHISPIYILMGIIP